MPAVVSLLRAVNLPGHQRLKMDALRTIYESLGLRGVQTYVASGNVVFHAKDSALTKLPRKIEDAIEKAVSFRPDVIHRTVPEMRDVIARNPFAARSGIEPGKLVVCFLAADPTVEARDKVLQIKTDPEELHLLGREMYIYFPNGQGRTKLSMSPIERALKIPFTARNWNTVTTLLAMAAEMEK